MEICGSSKTLRVEQRKVGDLFSGCRILRLWAKTGDGSDGRRAGSNGEGKEGVADEGRGWRLGSRDVLKPPGLMSSF